MTIKNVVNVMPVFVYDRLVYRLQQVVVESNGPSFGETEWIQTDSLSESNRIDSNRE